ncbi:MAG: FecCD family ABC transporter permease [Opitutales bacterium]
MPTTASSSAKQVTHRRSALRRLVIVVLLILLPMSAMAALLVGPMEMKLVDVLKILANGILGSEADSPGGAHIVIWEIRLPRVLLSVLIGCGLAVAGASMQGVFRNPLADPGIIGVSGGGAMGAIAMIVLGNRIFPQVFFDNYGIYIVPAAAMLGAIAITFLIYRLSLQNGSVNLIAMLLIGIAINALGGSFIGFLTFISNDEELRTLTFWNLGSLGRATWSLIIPAFVFMVLPLFLIPHYATALNALLLGESEARYLGLNTARVKRNIIILSASLVGVSVALCGGIGFIALVAPHMVRSMCGPDHRILIPASGLLGAIILTLGDIGARTLAAPAELPIGILTALIGAPVFLYILIQWKRSSAH